MAMIINDENFDQISKTELPLVIDCGATWCGPCQHLAPIIDELAADYEGKAVICKADVEESPDLAARYRVRSVPTVLFIKDGVVRDKSVGLVAKETLADKLNALL